MKKLKYIAIMVILLFMAGCGILSSQAITEDNPLGFVDPNQAAAFFEAGRSAAGTAQAVGVATGNPALIGGSVLTTAIIMLLGGSYLKGKMK